MCVGVDRRSSVPRPSCVFLLGSPYMPCCTGIRGPWSSPPSLLQTITTFLDYTLNNVVPRLQMYQMVQYAERAIKCRWMWTPRSLSHKWCQVINASSFKNNYSRMLSYIMLRLTTTCCYIIASTTLSKFSPDHDHRSSLRTTPYYGVVYRGENQTNDVVRMTPMEGR